MDDEAARLLRAELVMCSPLTRAIQTCLIGMQPLLLPAQGACAPAATSQRPNVAEAEADADVSLAAAVVAKALEVAYSQLDLEEPRQQQATVMTAHTVMLNPNLREKRNFGGKDSSGKWCGAALTAGVHAELSTLYADVPSTAEALCTVPLDLSAVENKWWLGSKESEVHVSERIAELLAQLRFAPQSTIVLVGHSHYFREMLRHFRSPNCKASDATGAPIDGGDLDAKKLSNAGIARCEFDWGANEAKPVTEVQLLFNSELVT